MLVPESATAVGQLEGRSAKPVVTRWVEVVNRGPGKLLFNATFVVTVLLPTLLAVLYFGFIASPVYISESRFVVRMPQKAQQAGVIGALLQGSGFQRAQDDAFSVHDFITSRDALLFLDKDLKVREAFSDPDLDPFSRFPLPWADASFESLFRHYGKHVAVNYDAASSITTLTVRAYSPEVAYQVNTMLLRMGETLVNRINERGRLDLVKFAMEDVAEAEAKAKAAAVALASYRNRRAVFDPDRQSALQLQQVTKLQDELIATKLQLAQVKALSPSNPQIPTLERRVGGLTTEISREMAKVAGGGNSFTDKAADYERLQLERTFADRQVASAMTNLETARSEARRQQLYLERIVQPNRPDEALEPRRLRAILATFLVGLVCWGVFSMLIAGMKEHRD
ncbi:hypothetical protein [Piscinibacter sakaiensis]|uniref:hypothetical protein n=1 Tax=Piscinibacter sakaiensis TaxID=1547922 RepID=UPI003AAF949D